MPLIFAITLFLSATLLFLVQPMIGQMIVPKFGGAPAVWITCMVFFQAALLLGYSYAHVTSTWLGSKQRILVHLGLLLIPFVVLPIYVAESWTPPGDASPMLWVLWLLIMTVGLPFLVVSTSAPLLQKWFADTGHPSSKDPYFLYAASNLGSMIALFCYPALVEPYLELPTQGQVWTIGYVMLVALIAGCAFLVLRAPTPAPIPALSKVASAKLQDGANRIVEANGARAEPKSREKKGSRKDKSVATRERPAVVEPPPATTSSDVPTWFRRMRWVALAFVPSSFSLAVTTYLTTDISAIPLLWVIPLALYLLSFILVFSQLMSRIEGGVWRFLVRSLAPQSMWPRLYDVSGAGVLHQGFVLILPVAILLIVFMKLSEIQPKSITIVFVMHLATLFLVAMVCHGELARDRPSTRYLTEFYLWMSVGGLLGGMFNLFAPVFSSRLIEYPVSMVIACLLLPAYPSGPDSRWARLTDIGMPIVLVVISLFLSIRPLLGLNEWLSLGRPGEISAGSSWAFIVLWRLLETQQGAWIQIALSVAVVAALVYIIYRRDRRMERALDIATAALLGVLTMILVVRTGTKDWNLAWLSDSALVKRLGISGVQIERIIMYGLPALICYIFVDRPVRFALCVASLLFVGTYLDDLASKEYVLHRERSFFGILTVKGFGEFPYRLHTLNHGTTLHGMQNYFPNDDAIDAAVTTLAATHPLEAVLFNNQFGAIWHERQTARTYYHRDGPIGRVFAMLKNRQGKDQPPPVAFVGLGTGTLASYAQPGQSVTYYEIDPAVVEIARNPAYFTYLRDAEQRGADIKIVLGDARLQLAARTEDPPYSLIVLDAFSSDAIPRHLITKEALAAYKSKLAPDGIVAFHVSNRHLVLHPVLTNLAEDLGWEALRWYDRQEIEGVKTRSDWVLLAANREAFGDLLNDLEHCPTDSRRWQELRHKPTIEGLDREAITSWKNYQVKLAMRDWIAEIRAGWPDLAELSPADQLALQLKEKNDVDEREAAKRQALDKIPDDEIKKQIGKEIDEHWIEEEARRRRAGLWTDNYSNLLSVFDW